MMNTRTVLIGSVAALALFGLSACGGGAGAADPAPAPAPVVTEEAPEGGSVSGEGGGGDSSGSPLGDANRDEYMSMGMEEDFALSLDWAGDVGTSDGSHVEYPDGLRIDFAGVEEGSAPVSEEEGDLNPDKSLVRVSLTVSNSGPDALPVDGGFIPFRVFEGENLVEVDAHVGYFGEEDDLYSADDASVVAPGSELAVYQSFEVEPGASLEVELNPDFFGVEHTPFVFYGITAP